MADILAILCSDTYKQCHPRMYPENTSRLVSYWVPRRSMFGENDKMVFFGMQAFIKEYLIKGFNEQFFDKPFDEVIVTYDAYMSNHVGLANVDLDRITELHKLGHLPLAIRALPEGSIVNMGVPCIEIWNTNEEFAWVVQWIECILQTELWKPCCHATMALKFRRIADYWYGLTSDADPEMSMADFGMRGMSGIDEACKASAAWLTSFRKTSTIPSLPWIDQYYGGREANVGIGAVSTEHSVMSANFAVDGDEISFVKRALIELYPNSSFSMVSDTYDYWNMVENIIPACKEEIMAHNGKLLIRPDSGDIVEISVNTVKKLWEIFGGTINSKGYKVLNPHIGVIYGDGCTMTRVEKIWATLETYGFAADNIYFGIGAFSFAAKQTNDGMILYTRDTYGIAMKATFAVINDEPVFLYKDPKTDTSHLKKSHKGCIQVTRDDNGDFIAYDGEKEIVDSDYTEMNLVFYQGVMVDSTNFKAIRERVAEGR